MKNELICVPVASSSSIWWCWSNRASGGD